MKRRTRKPKAPVTALRYQNLPLLVPIKVETNRDFPGCFIGLFKCACGRTHVHGLHPDEPYPAHRIAHCDIGAPFHESGYFIVMEPLRGGRALLRVIADHMKNPPADPPDGGIRLSFGLVNKIVQQKAKTPARKESPRKSPALRNAKNAKVRQGDRL
jgi:hypothetical protein